MRYCNLVLEMPCSYRYILGKIVIEPRHEISNSSLFVGKFTHPFWGRCTQHPRNRQQNGVRITPYAAKIQDGIAGWGKSRRSCPGLGVWVRFSALHHDMRHQSHKDDPDLWGHPLGHWSQMHLILYSWQGIINCRRYVPFSPRINSAETVLTP